MNENLFPSFDDKKLYFNEFNKVNNPKGVVQIIHGMAEYGNRYMNVINFLNKNGFIVFISDLRGHGKTVESAKHSGIYDGDIFYDIVKDQVYISEYLLDKYKLPLIVLGHSFGSFIAQRYAQLYNKHSALILSGSSFLKNDPALIFGKLIARLGIKLKGADAPAKLIANMSFKKYSKGFKDQNWLTSDVKEQRKQKVDPYLNQVFSFNFYKYFFKGLNDIYKRKNIAKVPLKTPIYLFSGKKDALSKDGNLVIKLKDFYRSNGVNAVKVKLYENGRHEMLNETNKYEVYKDLLNFIENNIKFKENKNDNRTHKGRKSAGTKR